MCRDICAIALVVWQSSLMLTSFVEPCFRRRFRLHWHWLQTGWTPLYWAATKGFKPIAEVLLANGANVNAADSVGHMPLHNAAILGNAAMVGLLLANGADVNARITAWVSAAAPSS